MTQSVRAFMERHYRHFNARETLEAAQAYDRHINAGGKMVVSLAGAMSTAELGISLAAMIREGKVHAISCTGANLEEDLFNLVAHNEYKMCPNYRDLTPEQEWEMAQEGFNRVTDTCIPESVMRHMQELFVSHWAKAAEAGTPKFPWEFCFDLIRSKALEPFYQIDPADSWMVAAAEADIPVYSPGFEDSTMGNLLTVCVMNGRVGSHDCIKPGTAQMEHLMHWYCANHGGAEGPGVGFFQIGGGIAGDFAICAVPLLVQDMKRTDVPFWGYFAQIGDSTTSYGSYSGAVPNEKITWWKLKPDTPRFMINSDASIVAPLVFGYVLGS